jgi:hypothetical protein
VDLPIFWWPRAAGLPLVSNPGLACRIHTYLYNLISFVTQNLIGSFDFSEVFYIACSNLPWCHNAFDFVTSITSVRIMQQVIHQIMLNIIYPIKLKGMKLVLTYCVWFNAPWGSSCFFIIHEYKCELPKVTINCIQYVKISFIP